MKNKTLKKQRGGDLGQILGASALGAFLLWGVSKAGSRNESGAVYKMRTENLNSSELARELNGQDIGPSKKFMIEQPVVPPSNKSLVPPSNKSLVPPSNESVVLPSNESVVLPSNESVVLPSNESVVLPKKKNGYPQVLEIYLYPKIQKHRLLQCHEVSQGQKVQKTKRKRKRKRTKKGKGKEKEQKKEKEKPVKVIVKITHHKLFINHFRGPFAIRNCLCSWSI